MMLSDILISGTVSVANPKNFPCIFQEFSVNVSEPQAQGHGLKATSGNPISFSVRFVLEAASWGGPEENQRVT